jgi:hypothetical protein
MTDVLLGLASWLGLNAAVAVALVATSFFESKEPREPARRPRVPARGRTDGPPPVDRAA